MHSLRRLQIQPETSQGSAVSNPMLEAKANPTEIKVFPLTLLFVTAQQAKPFPLQSACHKISSVPLRVFHCS